MPQNEQKTERNVDFKTLVKKQISPLIPERLKGVHLRQLLHYRDFHGSLGNALEAIIGNLDKNDPETNAMLTTDAAIVVNGILAQRADLEKDNKNSLRVRALMPLALKMAAAVDNADPDALALAEILKRRIEQQGFLEKPIIDEKNELKVRAFTPEVLIDAFLAIRNFAGDRPIVLAAIAEGGTAPGIALIEMHKKYLQSKGIKVKSKLVVIRNKVHGEDADKKPLVSDREIGRIQGLLEDRVLVLFNDHSETGETIDRTFDWAKENIVAGKTLRVAGIAGKVVARVFDGNEDYHFPSLDVLVCANQAREAEKEMMFARSDILERRARVLYKRKPKEPVSPIK